eukprot:Seg975.1 transcript_id=Seg975.1/GoldUCD/mRNA.D3Y31 product="hypothetical protein" protein_id=Seg975.1/GoldUCD/D3Y31
MCRNLLVKYGISSFEPRDKIDEYKKTLHPSVAVDNLSASVSVKYLFHSTLHAILTCEGVLQKLDDLPGDSLITLSAKAGLDGFGSHIKRHQLFVFYTRPIQLAKAKESRNFVASFFPKLQSDLDSLRSPHEVAGVARNVVIDTKISMIDGKMVDILHGDSGAFCHYCDISKNDASSFDVIIKAGVGGMPISKTVEECKHRWKLRWKLGWKLVESGEIDYKDSQRKGQCHLYHLYHLYHLCSRYNYFILNSYIIATLYNTHTKRLFLSMSPAFDHAVWPSFCSSSPRIEIIGFCP